ncbi:hypothetical protein [Tepidimonas ignava]|uniref:hypothetical protein n=1 Tax=Tepidimonas ignava TaxID=114249 RepID=UPI00163DC156|nr:hypothetical protein [Tepidimonas ignava]
MPVATQASVANPQASAATQASAANPQAPIPVAQQFSIEDLMRLARPFKEVPQVPIPQPIETPRLTGEQGRLRKIELGEHVTTVEEMLDNSMRLLSVPPCPPEQSRAVAQAMIDQYLQDIANNRYVSQHPPFIYELAIFFYAHFVRDYDRSHDPLIGFRDAGDVWEPMMIEVLKRRPPYGDAVELWALRRLRLPDEEKAKLTMTSFVRYVSGLIRDIITDAVRRRRAQLQAKPA